MNSTGSKIFAALGILVGGLESLLALAVAFGAHITPDQHTALGSVSGLLLLVIGLWFHPAVPVGIQAKKT